MVDITLRNKARKYLEYVCQQENMRKKDGQQSLALLNGFLKEEIQKDINSRVIQKVQPLFTRVSKNPKFFQRLMEILVEQTFGPEEFI